MKDDSKIQSICKFTKGEWCGDDTLPTAINCGRKHIAMINMYNNGDPERSVFGEEHAANARLIQYAPQLLLDRLEDQKGIGKWLSAALEDPNVCEEFKVDITEWFARFETVEKALNKNRDEIINALLLTDDMLDKINI